MVDQNLTVASTCLPVELSEASWPDSLHMPGRLAVCRLHAISSRSFTPLAIVLTLRQHWHGLSQRMAPFSDGTPLVRQWSIAPRIPLITKRALSSTTQGHSLPTLMSTS